MRHRHSSSHKTRLISFLPRKAIAASSLSHNESFISPRVLVSESTTHIFLCIKKFHHNPLVGCAVEALGSAGETAPRSRLSTFFRKTLQLRANFLVPNEIVKSNLATWAKIFGRTWRLIKMQIRICECSDLKVHVHQLRAEDDKCSEEI